jgi:hypothetical protein
LFIIAMEKLHIPAKGSEYEEKVPDVAEKKVFEIAEKKVPEREEKVPDGAEKPQEAIDIPRVAALIERMDRTTDQRIKYLALFELLQYFSAFPSFVTDYPQLAHEVRQKLKNAETAVNELVMYEQITFEEGADGMQIVQKILEMTAPLADFDHVEEAPVADRIEVVPPRLRAEHPVARRARERAQAVPFEEGVREPKQLFRDDLTVIPPEHFPRQGVARPIPQRSVVDPEYFARQERMIQFGRPYVDVIRPDVERGDGPIIRPDMGHTIPPIEDFSDEEGSPAVERVPKPVLIAQVSDVKWDHGRAYPPADDESDTEDDDTLFVYEDQR